MFSDPQTITINSVAKVLARVETNGRQSIYQNSDQTYTLTISHRFTKSKGRERVSSVARLDQRALVTDPVTSVTDYDTMSEWHVFERPVYGFTVTQMQQQAAGFFSFLDATVIAKIFGGES